MPNTLRFAVMGDMHYVRPEGHAEAFAGRPKGVTELTDLKRNLWMTQHVTPKVLAAIKALQPDFVVQTGDLIHGHCDDTDGNMQEMAEALDLISSVEAPVFFALGTHDGTLGKRADEPVRQLLLPAIGRHLGDTPATGYYSFVRQDSLFIILDYATFVAGGDQQRFLEAALEQSAAYAHVFILAHPPVVPVGRPFFTAKVFADTVAAAAARYRVDAYFCGHTHNQVASLHKIGDFWLPQLKSTVLAYPDASPIFLQQVRPILPSPTTMELGWAFLEDTAPSWWLVTVSGDKVQADWHVLGQGVQGQLQWHKGEKACFTRIPAFEPEITDLPALEDIRSMRLRVTGSNCREYHGYGVSLNNHFIDYLPRLEYFDSRLFLAIPPELWPFIHISNTLILTTACEEMCIGGFVLEIETASGWTRSTPPGRFYANCTRWDGWNVECLSHISPGQTLVLNLDFTSQRMAKPVLEA